MKVHAQKSKQPHQPASLNTTGLSAKPLATQTIEDSSTTRFAHDFSSVPAFSKTPVPGTLQPKLTLSAPGDTYEQEADYVADRIVHTATLQHVQAKAAGSTGSETVPSSIVNDALTSAGEPLDSSTRAFMEPRFGRDLSQVQIHTGPAASLAALGIGADAFTVGKHIVFGDRQYAPDGNAGRHLLAHELTHVLQQRTGAPALQRRAKNCPGSPPVPPTINTMADFIALVRRIEASSMLGGDPLEMARLITRTKYEGRAWDWMLPTTKGKSGVQLDPQGVGQVTASDLASLCFKLIVTMPGGGQEDPMHVIVALVADAETQAAGTGATGLSRLVRSLPASVSQRDAVTWVGDVGKAAAYWMVDYPLPGGGKTKADYMREDAPPHDLMADIDGVALTARFHAASLGFDRSKPLSENLQRFYFPAAHTGRERRFHLFCSAEGFPLESDGVTLSADARRIIGERVEAFARWLHSTDKSLISHVTFYGQGTAYGLEVGRRKNDWQWFADQFITFVQTNLTAEGR